tara:strand:+ start:202 stop:423 length:222 start_codon:yes stop_codon:yes gene_type:complete
MSKSEKIKEIISKEIRISKNILNKNDRIGDHPNWDSLSHMKIISNLEKKFNKKVNPSLVFDLDNVDKLIKHFS